jgi:cadmium resistance protein CadD (predicted permease)
MAVTAFVSTNIDDLFILMLLTVLIFGLLTALWCLISLKLATHPVIRKRMETYQHILVPVVFIGLGIFILLKNGTLVLIGQIF